MTRLQSYAGGIWRNHQAKLLLSIFCVLVAIFDTFFKTLSPIAAGALSIALVPWVLDFIERISAPGGFELVFSKAKETISQSESTPQKEDLDAFAYFSGDDPNLSIAMLRVQIERRLREIAETVMLDYRPDGRPRTLRLLAEDLKNEGAISAQAVKIINDLMPVMNEAVHGVTLNRDAAQFAKEYGPKILSILRAVPTDSDI